VSPRAPALVLAALLAGLLPAVRAPLHAATLLQAEQEARQAHAEATAALAAGRLDEAELLLERVLMLMPEHAEARLDFALLLARRGQPEAARELILGLAQDPRTPAAYRPRLLELAASVAALAPPAPGAARGANGRASQVAAPATAPAGSAAPPQWRAELALAGSTNPLARTGAEGVVITLPDGPVALPLTTRPQAGTVASATLLHLRGQGGVELSVQQMDRAAAAAARATAWGPLHVGAPQGLPLQVQWQLQTVRGFDATSRHTATLAAASAAQMHHTPTWRLALGAYAEPAQEDRGHFLRLEHRMGTPGPASLQAQASLERSGSSTRPQGYWRLNLAVETPLPLLSPRTRLQAQFSAQDDTHPYSPLLENNALRRLRTASLGLEHLQPLGARHALAWRAFAARRTSNLSLFNFQDVGAQLALVRQW
jgi:hypothetical protein